MLHKKTNATSAHLPLEILTGFCVTSDVNFILSNETDCVQVSININEENEQFLKVVYCERECIIGQIAINSEGTMCKQQTSDSLEIERLIYREIRTASHMSEIPMYISLIPLKVGTCKSTSLNMARMGAMIGSYFAKAIKKEKLYLPYGVSSEKDTFLCSIFADGTIGAVSYKAPKTLKSCQIETLLSNVDKNKKKVKDIERFCEVHINDFGTDKNILDHPYCTVKSQEFGEMSISEHKRKDDRGDLDHRNISFHINPDFSDRSGASVFLTKGGTSLQCTLTYGDIEHAKQKKNIFFDSEQSNIHGTYFTVPTSNESERKKQTKRTKGHSLIVDLASKKMAKSTFASQEISDGAIQLDSSIFSSDGSSSMLSVIAVTTAIHSIRSSFLFLSGCSIGAYCYKDGLRLVVDISANEDFLYSKLDIKIVSDQDRICHFIQMDSSAPHSVQDIREAINIAKEKNIVTISKIKKELKASKSGDLRCLEILTDKEVNHLLENRGENLKKLKKKYRASGRIDSDKSTISFNCRSSIKEMLLNEIIKKSR